MFINKLKYVYFLLSLHDITDNSWINSTYYETELCRCRRRVNPKRENSGNSNQGIFSVPGIVGYEWVPARLACIYQNKILFLFNQQPIKNRKTGTKLYAEPSPVQCTLLKSEQYSSLRHTTNCSNWLIWISGPMAQTWIKNPVIGWIFIYRGLKTSYLLIKFYKNYSLNVLVFFQKGQPILFLQNKNRKKQICLISQFNIGIPAIFLVQSNICKCSYGTIFILF